MSHLEVRIGNYRLLDHYNAGRQKRVLTTFLLHRGWSLFLTMTIDDTGWESRLCFRRLVDVFIQAHLRQQNELQLLYQQPHRRPIGRRPKVRGDNDKTIEGVKTPLREPERGVNETHKNRNNKDVGWWVLYDLWIMYFSFMESWFNPYTEPVIPIDFQCFNPG